MNKWLIEYFHCEEYLDSRIWEGDEPPSLEKIKSIPSLCVEGATMAVVRKSNPIQMIYDLVGDTDG